MLGRERAKEVLERALTLSEADQTEAVLMAEDSYLTRFANSEIHQNVAERNGTLFVRVAFGKKVGHSSTNLLNDEGIALVVERAAEIASLQRENPDFTSLPGAKPIKDVPIYVPETASVTPEMRAAAAGTIIERARKSGLDAFGAVTSGVAELGVANSLGVFAYAQGTDAGCNVVVMGDTNSGYAQQASRDFRKLDFDAIGARAVEKAEASRDPIELEAGEGAAVLEPRAVADMIMFLAFLGFGALSVQEERSFMCGKFGQKIVGENISIWDDGLDERGFAIGFDFEGVPKQRVDFITDGVASAVAYDSLTAGKEGKESTGHALIAPNPYGPIPISPVMGTGDSTIEEMIADTKRGIYVTRFHYTNTVEPMRAVITGMTRDGTFLIEDGKITKPLKNLRFTESVLSALSCVTHISKEAVLVWDGAGYGPRFPTGIIAPAIRVEKFNFSGVTQF
ncbi:MAG: hypothetical protein AMJ46_07315 [Latescibacteria bacterium DG_63]|uniref:TldD/PmbA family protein n=2 Tax=Bacteria division TA06 TaxID=1156500 RepID=A0A0S8JP13_UNCT6|nr:MAG: hypothetical protein AMJ46_07315 [Latescibacteria bacterium DG_63]KPK70523.1 MAG: hypothetical protein AMJ82_03060 [candidate division TA06 bacterium SM23_40]KPL10493.1 MAG: hypothetical protein AMJ71_03000 [candidate division TA06 bacterium SM1_40]